MTTPASAPPSSTPCSRSAAPWTALLNTVAVAATTAWIAANPAAGPAGMGEALTAGYTRAFLVGSGFMVLAAIVAFFMITIGKEAAAEDDEPVVQLA